MLPVTNSLPDTTDLEKIISEVRKEFRARCERIRAEQSNFIADPIQPRHDDIYFAGVEWLNKQ
jgi:hypothetical protein